MVRYIFLIIFLFSSVNATEAKKEKKVKLPLLRDGFILTGVDGKVTARGQKWFFELEQNVADNIAKLPKGTRLEMLESAGLEKMLVQINENPDASFRLYNAMVTTYENKNYVFCDYFVPISEAQKTNTEKDPKSSTEIRINEPNDTVMIPQEIIDRLSTTRIIQPQEIQKGAELKQDSILSGRTGFIKKSDDKMFFVFDSLGRNKAKAKLQLLPCQALERAQRKMDQEPERMRFKVSGIVTKYKGMYYLLLQRVISAYNYGNFGG